MALTVAPIWDEADAGRNGEVVGDACLPFDGGAQSSSTPWCFASRASRARLAIAALVGAAFLGVALAVCGAKLRQVAPIGLVALDDAQAELATCVIDVDQAAAYLVQAVNFIRFSADSCRGPMVSRDDRMGCAASVTTVIASFGWLGSYVSAAVSSCGSGANPPAACAASLSGFVACLGEFGFVASAVVGACDSIPLSPPPVQPQPVNPLRGYSISQCVVDLNVGLTYVGRIGIQTYFLTEECPQFGRRYDRKTCALDVFNVISSIAWAAQFLANAAVDCPEVGDAGAACAGVITDFVATVAALGPLVNGITDDCQLLLSGAGAGAADFE